MAKKRQGKCVRVLADLRRSERGDYRHNDRAKMNAKFLCVKLGNSRWCAEHPALQSAAGSSE
jgi:hypothetical protein